MRKLVMVFCVGLAVAVAFPLVNLFKGGPKDTSLHHVAAGNAEFGAVSSMLEDKCGDCHLAADHLPFYAKFPIARDMIQKDRTDGLRFFNLEEDIAALHGIPSEPTLAKLEYEIETGAMPPARYWALHWNARVGQAEKTTLIRWIRAVRAKSYASAELSEEAKAEPIHPLPTKIADEPADKVELGKLLYHDKRLSGDNTISCASCHDLAKGGTDQQQVSDGIRGQKGGINAPTTFNARYQFAQFWDGRAATLEEQAGGPPLNPVEMGSSWPQIISKLSADPVFSKTFAAAYPQGLTPETIRDAIATFERTLVTPNSRFDQFLLGQHAALSAEEQRGWKRFRELGCHTCHVGKLLGGQSYELISKRYFADRKSPTDADNGRFHVTKKDSDRYKFKVPTLRNIEKTSPYFHDGTIQDLAGAVRAMGKYIMGIELAPDDVTSIVAFLKTLTGTYQGKPL